MYITPPALGTMSWNQYKFLNKRSPLILNTFLAILIQKLPLNLISISAHLYLQAKRSAMFNSFFLEKCGVP